MDDYLEDLVADNDQHMDFIDSLDEVESEELDSWPDDDSDIDEELPRLLR